MLRCLLYFMSTVLQYTSDSFICLLTVVLDVSVFIVCVWGRSHHLSKVNHVGTYSKILKLQVHKQEYIYLLSRVKVSSTSLHCHLWLRCKGLNKHKVESTISWRQTEWWFGEKQLKEQQNHWVNGKEFFFFLLYWDNNTLFWKLFSRRWHLIKHPPFKIAKIYSFPFHRT